MTTPHAANEADMSFKKWSEDLIDGGICGDLEERFDMESIADYIRACHAEIDRLIAKIDGMRIEWPDQIDRLSAPAPETEKCPECDGSKGRFWPTKENDPTCQWIPCPTCTGIKPKTEGDRA